MEVSDARRLKALDDETRRAALSGKPSAEKAGGGGDDGRLEAL
jgi:hypothetical protein